MPRISNRLFAIFRRLDGARFFAHLSATTSAPTNDRIPYRLLLVKSPGIVKAGDVVLAPGGDKILVLEYSSDQPDTEAYRAAYASNVYVWQRREVLTDSVSLVRRDNGLKDMGNIYTCLERPESVSFEGAIDTRYRLLTGEDVQSGDLIGGKTVKRVYESMGVKAVEIE